MLLDELSSLSERNINLEDKIYFSEHHLSHAASAYYPSPFEDAAILTMDGVGSGQQPQFLLVKKILYRH